MVTIWFGIKSNKIKAIVASHHTQCMLVGTHTKYKTCIFLATRWKSIYTGKMKKKEKKERIEIPIWCRPTSDSNVNTKYKKNIKDVPWRMGPLMWMILLQRDKCNSYRPKDKESESECMAQMTSEIVPRIVVLSVSMHVCVCVSSVRICFIYLSIFTWLYHHNNKIKKERMQ